MQPERNSKPKTIEPLRDGERVRMEDVAAPDDDGALHQPEDVMVWTQLPIPDNVVAKPVSIFDIWPDPVQPRRVIPSLIRGVWDGNPAEVLDVLHHWQLVVETQVGTALDIRALLNGGDGLVLPDNPLIADFVRLVTMAASIKADGLTNPITVSQQSDRYQIETGERRWLCFHLLCRHFGTDWQTIPARQVKHDVWRQASENNVRANLNAIARARQLALLLMDLNRHGDGVHFDAYEALVLPGECDRRYYAQAINLRIPKGFAGRVHTAMNLNSDSQVSQYRALLSIPDDIWLRADTENWPEFRIRETVASAIVKAVTTPKVEPETTDTFTGVKVSAGQEGSNAATPEASPDMGDDPASGETWLGLGKDVWVQLVGRRQAGVVIRTGDRSRRVLVKLKDGSISSYDIGLLAERLPDSIAADDGDGEQASEPPESPPSLKDVSTSDGGRIRILRPAAFKHPHIKAQSWWAGLIAAIMMVYGRHQHTTICHIPNVGFVAIDHDAHKLARSLNNVKQPYHLKPLHIGNTQMCIVVDVAWDDFIQTLKQTNAWFILYTVPDDPGADMADIIRAAVRAVDPADTPFITTDAEVVLNLVQWVAEYAGDNKALNALRAIRSLNRADAREKEARGALEPELTAHYNAVATLMENWTYRFEKLLNAIQDESQ